MNLLECYAWWVICPFIFTTELFNMFFYTLTTRKSIYFISSITCVATYALVNYSEEERKYSGWNWKGFLEVAVFQWCLPVRLLVVSNKLPPCQSLLNCYRKFFSCFWCWHMTCSSDGGLWPLSGTQYRRQTCLFGEIIPWLKACASICSISLLQTVQKTDVLYQLGFF